ncbi:MULTISPECIES: ATP-dependent helicase [Stappiaceae]|jgi:DNA helicase-2/ATP-dependent DNA helicase PcrA|uniref:DNA 3'-5' helicase n=2 Tax=Roseibium TaxID=150830 RepID=A0A0M6Y3H5_9HYPH|nr:MULTISPECIES: UvrD-helicase domain-containing protein [Stappiaceae]AMN52598.1 ATP-dependent DNA helicase [Labrenzia sp. CP4]AQQ05792.1 ATP-dependent DNA helicase [Roseibium aggregatum]MBO6856301.1 UvrD-helicase domain-containing protein [Roseibium sp.]NKX65733.1 UvrD-helicase domain-containing protein [Labrenzia sp. 5N]UES50052.1 AAA family ATPase [Roseibium aggregatum]
MTDPDGYDDSFDDPFQPIGTRAESAPAPVRPQGGIAARAMAARRAPDYLTGLNPEQRLAVETTEGPVLVLAGAGTGKTRVLTTRIAHILATGLARPSEILAVTFTNKASREMKERIAGFVGGNVEGMAWLGTFHSICVKILRKHAELVGLKSSFSILDTDDQIRLIKQIIQAEGLDDKRWTAKAFAGMLDGWKNRALGPKDIPEGEARAFANGKGRKLYEEYQERLSILNAADFGDLLLHVITLFKTQPDVLKEYQRRFRYMLVDEYQDTNIAQYLWLRLLAQGNPNVCCVGDDDQSIYGWRGAEVDNILRFEHDFKGATVIRLERNYRSTSHILAAASHLIAFNEGRLGKTLFTDFEEPDHDLVSVASVWDSEEEARTIGDEIETLQSRGHSLNEMAVLVRASFQMREFEDRFVTLGLNYRVIGGPRFYERMEIRDAMAYFRCVAQPADDLAFERIVNTPKRGLGDATLKLVHGVARAERIPLMQAASQLIDTEELKPKPRNALKSVLDNFERWRRQLDQMKHTELAEIILDESGYTEMWRQDRSAEAPGRLDNLKELIRSMDEFESMAGFLEHISLVMDRDSADATDAVSIMTLHSAKGLEFDTVFLPGWEEGLFPHQRALDESGRAGLEEERRLAYVGITRAKKRAKLYFASNRRIHGLWQSTVPSRFLDELPPDHVEIAEASSSYGGYGGGGYGPSRFDSHDPFDKGSYSTPGWQRAQRAKQSSSGFSDGGGRGYQSARQKRQGPLTIEGELVAKSVSDTPSQFSLGERVFHIKFGYGAIKSIEGNKLTIDFEKAGVKKVIDSFVERH